MANKTNNRENNNIVSNTQFVCPECGAKLLNLPEHSHAVSGIAIGKDSNLGIQELPRTKDGKRRDVNDMLSKMRDKGIDVSNYFAIRGANGGSALGKMEDGVLTMVDSEDPILKQILDEGDIPNRDLFRRWVMAQMFRALSFKGYGSRDNGGGFNCWLRYKGYEYQWSMTEEELRVQTKLAVRDEENFKARNLWFNKALVLKMCEHYEELLRTHLDNLRVKRCKGAKYVHVDGKDVFVSDLWRKVWKPFYTAYRNVRNADSVESLYTAVYRLNRIRVKMEWKTEQCREWIDAYKGVGAYYTMQNLIRFHYCKFWGENGNHFSKENALRNILLMAKEYAKEGCGYKMLGALKQLLVNNGIDIEKKMAEWRK